MGQIVKKKKGRPSKADLAARAAAESTNGSRNHRIRDTDEEEEEQRDIRRSLRRRSCVRYNLLDYDEDYLDDDQDFDFDDDQMEDDDEEGGGKREKKLKFVLKLPNSANRGRSIRSNGGGRDSTIYDRRAGYRGSESEGEEEEEEEETRFVKKRKICGDGDDEDEVDDDYSDNEDEEETGGKAESYKFDFVHGTSNVFPSRAPIPEKKQLELILDKLQKKDTYGVYAEPVDPDELPDYHEIIKHPMDFATVRKKLADGLYSTLEQFESDIYLICSNAMQYNAPDTIYHKQAYAIKELAQKKFQRVRRNIEWTRIEDERIEKEAKSEQKMKSNPVIRKQMKRPISRSTQDPVSSDFSSGATLATTDAHNTSSGVQASNHERPSNVEGPAEGISSLAEDSIDKVEDLQSGKGMTSKFGRKPLVVDENRRGTYEISNQPVDRSESIYSTFEGEDKQLIPVGLYEEHSYAESLARFAATLGPVAWRIASKRIEEALPPGSKFGRGWVVEYEPIPTPVLFVAGQYQEYSSAKKPQGPAVSMKTDKPGENLVSSNEQVGPSRNGKTCFLPCSGGSRPPTPGSATAQQNPFVRKLQNAAIPVKGDKTSESPSAYGWGEKRPISDAKLPHMPSLGGSRPATPAGVSIQQQHPFVRKLQNAYIPAKTVESPESVVTTSERLDSGSISEGKSTFLPNNSRGSRPSTPTGAVIQMQNPFSRNNMRPDNTVTTRIEADTLTSINQKSNFQQQMRQYPGSAEIATSLQVDAVARDTNFLHSVSSKPPSPASEGVFMGRFPNWNVNGSVDMNRMACSPSNGASAQVIGKKPAFPPRQEQGLSDPVQAMKLSAENAQKYQSTKNNMLSPLQVRPCIQSIPAVGSWMHASAADMNRHASGNLSSHSNQIPADSLYNRARGEMYPHILQSGEYPVTRHFQPERSRAMVYSQVSVTDQSRNPLQSPCQGLTEQKKKRDSLPPDLNVAFQSTVDPQQPDLALQL